MSKKRELFFSISLLLALGAILAGQVVVDEMIRLIVCGCCIVLGVISFYFGLREVFSHLDNGKESDLEALRNQAQEQARQVELLSGSMAEHWSAHQSRQEQMAKEQAELAAKHFEERQKTVLDLHSTAKESAQQTKQLLASVLSRLEPLERQLSALQEGGKSQVAALGTFQTAVLDRIAALEHSRSKDLEALRDAVDNILSTQTEQIKENNRADSASLEQKFDDQMKQLRDVTEPIERRLSALQEETKSQSATLGTFQTAVLDRIAALEKRQSNDLAALCDEVVSILSTQAEQIEENNRKDSTSLERKFDDQIKQMSRAQDQNVQHQEDLLEALKDQIAAVKSLQSSFERQIAESRNQLTRITKQYSEVTDKDIQVLERLLKDA